MATWSAEMSEAATALFAVELMVRLGYGLIHLEGNALSVDRVGIIYQLVSAAKTF